MLEVLSVFILEFIKTHAALAVFFGVLIEEVVIPIPSSLILLGSGFLLIPPELALADALVRILLVIVIPASVAATIGSFFPYAIGYYGGERIVKKLGRLLDFSWKDVQKTGRKLGHENKIWAALVVARAAIIVPMSVVAVAAGALRLPWKKYALATFVGTIPRALILALAGWKFGGTYTSLTGGLNLIEQLMAFSFLSFAAYFFYRHLKKRRS